MMSVAFEPLVLPNPNPNHNSLALASSPQSPAILRLKSHLRVRRIKFVAPGLCSRGLSLGLFPMQLQCRSFRNRSVLSFAASHEESPSEVEVEKEKNDPKDEGEELEEAWNQTLESFKEQALKIQSVSQEAYELYSKKAMVILKATAVQMKIQSEKARYDLSVIAKEISEEGKEYLSTAAKNSPEEVKDIVETFASSTDDVNEISKMRDFYLGIPYGILLSFGGFLSFMLTGSTSAIRFGIILGGTLLALSILSLRSWKRGESSPLALKGQAVIASVLFLREIRLLFQRPSFGNFLTALVSGAMVAFYLYRTKLDGEQTKGSNLEHDTKN